MHTWSQHTKPTLWLFRVKGADLTFSFFFFFFYAALSPSLSDWLIFLDSTPLVSISLVYGGDGDSGAPRVAAARAKALISPST